MRYPFMIWFTARAALTLMLLAAPSTLQASAYPQPRGEGRVYSTLIISKSDRGYDDRGDVIDIADFDQVQLYLNGEYGVTEDLTVLLATSFRDISVEGKGRDTTGLNFVEGGARYRIASAGRTQFALQGTVRVPGQTFRDPIAQISQQGTEFDMRAQVGTSFGRDGSAGFIIAEGGYRFRGEAPPNEYHFDLTVGVHAAPRMMLMAYSSNTISDGDGRSIFRAYRYHNLYLSAVFDINDRVSFQAGLHRTLNGRNALRERGLIAGLWFSF
jgi:hypothetical protein